MVIVKLTGGLGNQLFQYALGRKIAHLKAVELKLDISGFKTYKLHKYSLSHFNIIEEFASVHELARFNRKGLIPYLTERLKPYYKRCVVYDRHHYFDKNIFKTNNDVYIDGYFQSEKYFSDIEPILRNEISFKVPPEGENMRLAELVGKNTSVSLHVRRGDYIRDPLTFKIHGVCSMDYYGEAVRLIAQRTTKPHFFIFSDDPCWAEKNLNFDYPVTFVTHNNADHNFEDLRLMSLCKHHIIANSTFSWWGAWLNANPEKIVVAPKKWLNSPEFYDKRDLLPEPWIKV
ncbi:MAG: alpha-1,2-fucosyltransferase [Candidatus Omnitrophica bacterium]|nr:alpha-1,2-fucosyltransferase [Candidatus Omnitrophota bacterium]MDD5652684.1 alpha-1,2-fucosyltransferase [Candidatus Omnitrophota bacterium]